MSETIERLNPRRQPRQARSRQMQADILAAAADILRRRGLPALNTNAVAERAGVSVGSLYQYFPGKDAILAALVREMRREMRGDLLEAVARSEGQALAPAVGALVEASLRHHARDPALTDALERAEDDLPMDAETGALKADMAALVTGHPRAPRRGGARADRAGPRRPVPRHGPRRAARGRDGPGLPVPPGGPRGARLPRRPHSPPIARGGCLRGARLGSGRWRSGFFRSGGIANEERLRPGPTETP